MPPATPAAVAPTPAPSGVAARPSRGVLGAVPAGVWVFADQGVVSLANFAAPVLVGVNGGQEELGYFTLGFSIYLFALGMARAVVWTAFTRRRPHLDAGARLVSAGSATVHLALFLVAAVAVVWGAALAAWLAGSSAYAALLAVAGPWSVAMLLREHVRRLALARFAFLEVFVFDVLVAAAQVVSLWWIASAGWMSANAAFVSLAVTSLLAVPYFLVTRESWRIDWHAVRPDWRANWSVSKWLAGGAAAVLFGNQGYRWLLSVIASVSELGRLGAAQTVVQLTNPLVLGAQNYLGPVSARVLAEDGVRGLWRFTWKTTAVMAAAIGSFLAAVALAGLPVVRAVFGASADGVTTLLLVTFTAGALSEALLVPIEFAMVNLGRSRLMFQTALVRLAINSTAGFALVGAFGAEAIGVGMFAGSLVALAWQWSHFAAEVRRG